MDTLKIFVSGTMLDMQPERETVARDKILSMAHECDIYLGLYNQTRYGWTIPQDDLSVTD